jgi:hypothetical protein
VNDVVCVVPLWRRTRNIETVARSFHAETPGQRLLFVVSEEDAAVRVASFPVVGYGNATEVLVVAGAGGEAGDYGRKINAGYRATREPFVFTGADDLLFHSGWWEAARALFTCPHGDVTCPCQDGDPCHYEGVDPMPCPTTETAGCATCVRVGVVGTRDICNGRTMNGTHSTHSLVARRWANCCAVIDQPGAIYHEGYTHEFCDDELVRSAMARGAYAHSEGPPVEHLHMLRDASLDDDTYRHGRANTRRNRQLFMRRRRLWGEGQPRHYTYPRPVVRRRP